MSSARSVLSSRALYRSFVAPNHAPRPLLQTQHAPAARPTPFLPITCARTKTDRAKPKRQAIGDLFTFDKAIKSTYIHFIDESGQFHRNVRVDNVTPRINRVTHHLLQVTEGEVDEFGNPNPDRPPICKIISKIDLRTQYNKKLDIEKQASKGPALKKLELNWAIAGGDLKHRLEKLKDFLKEGRKVEVLLGPKRRGKKATDAECKSILKTIQDVVDGCKGANEVKREGTVGGVLTLTLQGRKLKEDEKVVEEQSEPTAAEPTAAA